MRSSLWVAAAAVSIFSACNQTVGECYPRGQGDGDLGLGGGVVITGGQGAYGNVPPSEAQGTSYPEADCNIAEQSPCDEKCLAGYDAAAAECGNIGSEAQRKACQDSAYATYKSCRGTCQQSNSCRKDCEDKAEACEAECRKLPKDDKAGRQKCWEACNEAYAKCIKKC